MPAEQAELYLVEDSGLVPFDAQTPPAERWLHTTLSNCLECGTDWKQDPLSSALVPGEQNALRAGMRSAWYLPLRRADKRVGLVALYASAPGSYRDADAGALAPLLALVTALAVERQLRNREQRIRHAQAGLAATEKLTALGQLAEGVAHEVNNPATYVLASLEHVRTLAEQAADAPRELLRAVDDGMEGIRRIRDVVGDLGLLSQDAVDPVEAVDVNRVVRAVVGLSSYRVSQRARIELDLGRVAPIASNKARLTQVLLDLVLNASQACSGERPDLDVVRVRTRANPGHVAISVSDTGCGIPPAHLPHIFEPFFTTKPAGQGSGLGLAVARTLVHNIGGRLRFDTRLGLGTTFTVELPGLRPAESHVTTSERYPAVARSRPKVLLIDDEPGIRRALERALRRNNDVTTLQDGDEAIEQFERGATFDVVISDLLLPGTSGIEIHAFLESRRPELLRRTLFVTGGATSKAARAFVAAHADHVLLKPVEGRRLDAIIQEVASGASVRSAIERTRAMAEARDPSGRRPDS